MGFPTRRKQAGCGAPGLRPGDPCQPARVGHEPSAPFLPRGSVPTPTSLCPAQDGRGPSAPLPPPTQGATVPEIKQRRPQLPSWTWDPGELRPVGPHNPLVGNVPRRRLAPGSRPHPSELSPGDVTGGGVPPPGPLRGVTRTSGSPSGSLYQRGLVVLRGWGVGVLQGEGWENSSGLPCGGWAEV